MPVNPCYNKVTCPDCYDPPISNLSAEATDRNEFVAIAYGGVPPPVGTWYNAQGCKTVCRSFVSQEEADICALRQSIFCAVDGGGEPPPPGDGGPGGDNGGGDDPWVPPGGGPGRVYVNTEQTCSFTCPNGDVQTRTIPAGTVASTSSQTDANRKAQDLCRQQILESHLCLNDSSLPPGCVNAAYNFTFGASGGSGTYLFTVNSAQMPLAMTFTNLGVLSGFPTTAGVYPLQITVVDSSVPPLTATHLYTLYLAEITTPSPMPTGTVGAAYSETLTATGAPPSSYWSIISGTLPNGLSLNPLTGVISGTPLGDGTFTFTVGLIVP